MNVASLELCKELYQLSGWDLTYFIWTEKSLTVDKLGTELWGDNVVAMSGAEADTWDGYKCPAYVLGYLLRKLPTGSSVEVLSDGQYKAKCYYGLDDAHSSGIPLIELFVAKADTPEDAVAKLAIELFKQGILVKENVNE